MSEERKTLELLQEFVKIQSVSTDPERKSHIIQAVGFLKKTLSSLGFTTTTVSVDSCPPLVIAKKHVSSSLPTIGIYGHYDVQPEDPIKEWDSPPFKLNLRNGKFYGRGVADDKGHIIQNLAAIDRLLKQKKLANNIIFLFEGEEEVASLHFGKLIKKADQSLKKIDAFVVTDVGMHQKGVPQIFYALRGIIYFELILIIGKRDLHSGIYGNRVLNPIQAVASLLSKIKDEKTGRILIPHFYDQVPQPTKKEVRLLSHVKRTDEEDRKEAGVFKVIAVDRRHPHLSTKLYPSFEAHGIEAGYTGWGSKTVIPHQAKVKFSFRLVEHQQPKRIETLVRQFIKENIPDGVKWQLTTFGQAAAFYTNIDNPYTRKMGRILTDVFKNKTLINRAGGSIKAVELLYRQYQKPMVLTGFTLPDDNVHAPNENIDGEMFWQGISVLERFYGQR